MKRLLKLIEKNILWTNSPTVKDLEIVKEREGLIVSYFDNKFDAYINREFLKEKFTEEEMEYILVCHDERSQEEFRKDLYRSLLEECFKG